MGGGIVMGVYRYQPKRFFALAYTISWIPWLIGAYAGSRPELAAYAGLSSFVGLAGPIGASLVLLATSGSPALKGDFRDRLLNLRRIRPLYALIAIAMPFAVIVLAIFLSLWCGGERDQFAAAQGNGLVPLIVLALVVAPLCEEMGWHGYGADSLRAETSMLKATLLFALLWSLWHAPAMLIPGTYQHQLAVMDNKIYIANFFVSIIPAGIIANWFYYKNDRSIAGAVLVHSMLNAASVLINAGQIAKLIATILYGAIAAALILGDRSLFGQGKRNFLTTEAEAPSWRTDA
jgi:uncharacterized protein